MFQLYKKRNFSELVGDTFTFFKMHGKHYYRNYFIINGGFLLVLLVLVYFMGNIFLDAFSSNLDIEMAGREIGIESFLSENLPLIIGLGIFGVILIIFLSILSYAFPVAYLTLHEKQSSFTSSEILAELKSKAGRIITFSLASIFVLLPMTAIIMAICFALVFLLIGIPLIFIMFPALTCWFSFTFYEYLNTDKSYFECLGSSFLLLKQKFWPSVFSSAVMYLIMQMGIGALSMIPYVIGIISMVTNLESSTRGPSSEGISFMMLMMGITMVISLLLNFIFQNFILVNQGIIYYSLREENENNSAKSEIDLIGLQSE